MRMAAKEQVESLGASLHRRSRAPRTSRTRAGTPRRPAEDFLRRQREEVEEARRGGRHRHHHGAGARPQGARCWWSEAMVALDAAGLGRSSTWPSRLRRELRAQSSARRGRRAPRSHDRRHGLRPAGDRSRSTRAELYAQERAQNLLMPADGGQGERRRSCHRLRGRGSSPAVCLTRDGAVTSRTHRRGPRIPRGATREPAHDRRFPSLAERRRGGTEADGELRECPSSSSAPGSSCSPSSPASS